MRSKHRGHWVTSAVVAVVLALLGAGCGSDGSTSTSASAASTTGSGDSAGVAQAKADVAKVSKRPTEIGVTEPIGAKVPSGKTVYFIPPSVPSALAMGPHFAEAAKALGWNPKTVPGGTSPEEFKAAYDKAIRDRPDAIFGAGIPPAVIQQELAKLASMKIPVVLLGAPVAKIPPKNVAIANIAGLEAHESAGAHLANWVTADSDGKANTLMIGVPDFPVLDAVRTGFEKQFEQVCPSCAYEFKKYPVTDVGKDLPQEVVGYLRAHPDIKYVVAEFDDMLLGMPGALADAGLMGVKLAGDSPVAADQVNIEAGNYEAAATIFDLHAEPWLAVDILARSFAGKDFTSSVNAPIAELLITKDNKSEWGGPAKQTWPVVETYREQYKKLWGLG